VNRLAARHMPAITRAGLRGFAQGSIGKALLTVIDQGVASVANFATQIIIGRYCLPAEFGLYLLGFSIVIFSINTQNSLITSSYVVFSPRKEGEEFTVYSGSALMHQLGLAGFIMFCLAVAAICFFAGPGTEGLDRVIGVLVVAIFFVLLKEFARQVSFARLHTHIALLIDSCAAAVQIGGLLLLAYTGLLRADRAFMLAGAGSAAAGGIWLISRRHIFRPVRGRILRDLRHNWRFSRWIFAMNFAYMGSMLSYPWIITWFHGPDETGIFAACNVVVLLTNPFLLGMSNFLGPKAAHAWTARGVPGVKNVVNKATLFFCVTMIGFCLLMVVAGGLMLRILYGDTYTAHKLTVIVLSCSQLAWSFTVPVNFALNAIERPDVAFKSLALSLVCTGTFGLWLTGELGALGAACGMLAGNALACIYTRVIFMRQMKQLAAGGTTP
jgi:O-antigen/teichoic acid export membrane protein